MKPIFEQIGAISRYLGKVRPRYRLGTRLLAEWTVDNVDSVEKLKAYLRKQYSTIDTRLLYGCHRRLLRS